MTQRNGRKKADLTKLIRRLKRESEKAGRYFNVKKTKIMTTAIRIMRKAEMEESKRRSENSRSILINLRYADDTTLMTEKSGSD